MPTIQPYLGFDGQAREALSFYQSCLGGELDVMTVADSPVAAQMPAEHAGRVLHGRLSAGDLTLNASDMAGDLTRTQSVSLMLQCEGPEQAQTVFGRLAQGGEVTYPLSPSFWGSTFGHVTDRYGIRWMINAPS